jgi:hypothetical protein
MALRLVDIYHSDDDAPLDVPNDTYDVLGHWTYRIDEKKRVDRVLLEVEDTEPFLDWVDDTVITDYRVVLQAVEATVPRPEVEDEEPEQTRKCPWGALGGRSSTSMPAGRWMCRGTTTPSRPCPLSWRRAGCCGTRRRW